MMRYLPLALLGAAFVFLAFGPAQPEPAAPADTPGELAGEKKAEAPETAKTDEPQEMEIHGISREVHSDSPVVVLSTRDKKRFLLVFIGHNEAAAILRETLRKTAELPPPPRPMTHDLLKNTIVQMGGTVDKITITKIDQGIFFAEISVRLKETVIAIDARPSDSMALAVRFKAPILVARDVLEEAGQSTPPAIQPDEEVQDEAKDYPKDAI